MNSRLKYEIRLPKNVKKESLYMSSGGGFVNLLLTSMVDDVGKFVELEKIVNGTYSEHQMGLKSILLTLESSKVEFADFGYDSLLYKKKIYNDNR